MSEDWKKALISPESTIQKCIEVINNGSLKVALIVDGNNKLLGTVTDGDVRRGLIQHIPLDAEVYNIMEKNPTTALVYESDYSLLRKIRANSILHIPILSKDGVLLRLRTAQDLVHIDSQDNSVFLMAGGQGKRLRPLTKNCPKPLLKVGNKPILETIIENFVELGFWDFYISVNYKSELIQEYFGDGSKWGADIKYLSEDKPLGTGGALGLLPDKLIQSPVIMMNGDILTKVDFRRLLHFHNETDAIATMCVKEYEFQVPYGVVELEDDFISSIEEKPLHQLFINAGIYVLNGEVIQNICKGENVDMPTVIERYIENRKVAVFPIHEYWLDIGQMPDFQKAQLDFSKDIT